jgi:hypothetical protein
VKDGREKKSEVARTRELLSWEVLAFFLAASLKPDIKALEASVKATIESFDFGVPVPTVLANSWLTGNEKGNLYGEDKVRSQ